MIILIFLAFLIPFTIDKNGEAYRLHEFWNKTSSHLDRVADGAKNFHIHSHDISLTYGVVIHGSIIVVSCIVVGIMSRFATNAYTVVK